MKPILQFSGTLLINLMILFTLAAQEPESNGHNSVDPGNQDALCTGMFTRHLFGVKGFNGSYRQGQFRHDSTRVWAYHNTAVSWDLQERYSYQYGPEGQLLSYIIEEWNVDHWENDWLYTYEYDDQGNLSVLTEQLWIGGTWRDYFKYHNTYDSNNNLIEQRIEEGFTGSLENYFLYLYTYDDNGNVLTQTTRQWQNIAWVNSIYRENTYENNLIVHQLRQDWEGGAWDNTFSYDYTYDTLSNLVEYYSWKWEGNWVTNYRNIYEYDDNQNRLLLQRQNPAGGNFWFFDYQYVYTYDAFNNELTSTEQDYSGNAWVNVDQFAYGYDPEQNQVSEVYREWEGIWAPRDSTYHYYNIFTGSHNPDMDQTEVTLYPNPATSNLAIYAIQDDVVDLEIEIYSVSGVLMMQGKINLAEQNKIDISKLSPGMYFIRIPQLEGGSAGTFIKY